MWPWVWTGINCKEVLESFLMWWECSRSWSWCLVTQVCICLPIFLELCIWNGCHLWYVTYTSNKKFLKLCPEWLNTKIQMAVILFFGGIHSFNKYLLGTYDVSLMFQVPVTYQCKRIKKLAFTGCKFYWGELDSNQIPNYNKQCAQWW